MYLGQTLKCYETGKKCGGLFIMVNVRTRQSEPHLQGPFASSVFVAGPLEAGAREKIARDRVYFTFTTPKKYLFDVKICSSTCFKIISQCR